MGERVLGVFTEASALLRVVSLTKQGAAGAVEKVVFAFILIVQPFAIGAAQALLAIKTAHA